MTYKVSNVLLALALIALGAFLFLSNVKQAGAAAPSGLNAAVATSSRLTLAAATVFAVNATSTNCASTNISTGGSAVMIGFDTINGTTTSGMIGMLQAASTTVSYDGGLYGCGPITLYSYSASLVNVMITR